MYPAFPARIGDFDDTHVRRCSECGKGRLDSGWKDIDAAGDDHVSTRVYDVEVAIRVQVADVARLTESIVS